MNIHDKIKIKGTEYEVLCSIGAGGQGAVWQVRCLKDGKIYALKLLQEKNAARLQSKVENVEYLVSIKLKERLSSTAKAKGINHVLPMLRYENAQTKETGYLMECVNGKTLSKLLHDGTVERMAMEKKLLLAQRVALAISILHDNGYCYTDINWGNFMWDEGANVLHVIDCENVACSADIRNGKCFLMGTGFFIAPEVAFGKANVGYETDRYALASLIFRLLTNNVLQSAYHGVAMYSAQPACQNMLEVAELEGEDDIDKNWRYYVFDPVHRENGIDNLCKNSKNPENKAFRKRVEEVLRLWKGLDDRLKELFLKSFQDPFDTRKRPTASLWATTIAKVLCNTPKANGQKGGKAVAAGGGQSQPKSKVVLTGSNGGRIEVTAETVINGEDFLMGQKKIGILRKSKQGYSFESALLCVVNIYGADNRLKESIGKGKSVELVSGDKISPSVDRATITLRY